MRLFVVLLLAVGLFAGPLPLHAEQTADAPAFPVIEDLSGITFRYHIGFLWMDHIADGQFGLQAGEEPGTFRARLLGKTRGVAAWLTSDRIQSYESLMRKTESGRLITLSHDSTIERGRGDSKKVRTKHYLFNPEEMSISVSKIADGDLWWEKSLPIEGEMPVDILTAYFNFVTGVYGPIAPGAVYHIPAFGGKGVGEIDIRVLTAEQRVDLDFFPQRGVLCEVTVDQEIFDTSDGTILVWYDSAGYPARGIVKDIIGMGDIRGVSR